MTTTQTERPDYSKCPSASDPRQPCRCYEIGRGLPYPEQEEKKAEDSE